MFDVTFMRLALIASIATGVSLGVMGVYLVTRRVVFLGLVVANAATLGAAVGHAVGWTTDVPSLAAAVAAAALSEVGTSSRVSAESLMGWAYAAASSATVLLLSWAPGGSTDTLHLLFGNVLAVQAGDVVQLAVIAAVIGVIQVLFARRFLLVTFDPEAATVAGVRTRLWSLGLNLCIGVAAATSVHAIGALLTFSLLTLPAMAALLLTASLRWTFLLSAVVGAIVPCVALASSFYLDLPAGPAAVALLALCVPLASFGGAEAARTGAAGREPTRTKDAEGTRPVESGRRWEMSGR